MMIAGSFVFLASAASITQTSFAIGALGTNDPDADYEFEGRKPTRHYALIIAPP